MHRCHAHMHRCHAQICTGAMHRCTVAMHRCTGAMHSQLRCKDQTLLMLTKINKSYLTLLNVLLKVWYFAEKMWGENFHGWGKKLRWHFSNSVFSSRPGWHANPQTNVCNRSSASSNTFYEFSKKLATWESKLSSNYTHKLCCSIVMPRIQCITTVFVLICFSFQTLFVSFSSVRHSVCRSACQYFVFLTACLLFWSTFFACLPFW